MDFVICDGHATGLVEAPNFLKLKIACIRFSQMRQEGFIPVFISMVCFSNTLHATRIDIGSSKLENLSFGKVVISPQGSTHKEDLGIRGSHIPNSDQ